MKKIWITFCAAAVVLAACNNAAEDSVAEADSINDANLSDTTAGQPMAADAETASFLVDAANGGMAEVQLGQLGQEKASSQRVKDFAAMIVSDHQAANDQVKSLAGQRTVALPEMVGDDKMKKIEDVRKKSGREFDRAFMDLMVDEHQAAIDLFEKAQNRANDSGVKTFVDNTLPKLRMHLDSAKAVRDAIK